MLVGEEDTAVLQQCIDVPLLGVVPYQGRADAHDVTRYLNLKFPGLKLLEQERTHD
jgi:hypothetical protein